LPPALSPPTAMRAWVQAQLGGAPRDVAEGGQGVVRGGREGVLGTQPIVDRNHHAGRGRRQRAARQVVRVDRAQGEAAAVVEHQAGGLGRQVLRPVQPCRQRTGGAIQAQLAHFGQPGRRRGEQAGFVLELPARLLQRPLRPGLGAAQAHQLQQQLGLQVQLAALQRYRRSGEAALQAARQPQQPPRHGTFDARFQAHDWHFTKRAPAPGRAMPVS
jgi:hypothetical protein